MRIFTSLFLVHIAACQSNEVIVHLPEKYAVIELDSNNQQLYENTTPTDLKFYEMEMVDSIVKYAIADYNRKQKEDFERLSSYIPGWEDDQERYLSGFDAYFRQYVPLINERGEKEIWIYCFCDVSGMNGEMDGLNWRTDLVQVNDGGNCHFHLVVNLTQKTFAHLMVNGLA